MKSECQSVHKPASWSGTFDPTLEVQCGLEAGHRGLHRGAGFSWPDENSLNPNRALNPAELRYVLDLISTLFAVIGFMFLLLGGLAAIFYPKILAIGLILIGLVSVFGSYRIWSRSLRI